MQIGVERAFLDFSLHWIDLKLVVPRSNPILSQITNSPHQK